MRVLRDLEIVEQLGSGIPRIVKVYGKEAFEIRKSLVRVILRFAEPIQDSPPPVETSGKTSGKIVEVMGVTPTITIPELAGILGVTERSIERNIRMLQEKGIIRRVGPAKGGHWQVLEGGDE
jgi:predicted HTH transcriptional regulator